jgi:phosphoserine phosphatase
MKRMMYAMILRSAASCGRQFMLGLAAMIFSLTFAWGRACAQIDPLPSWSEGAAKKAITDFVARVTKQGTPDFVPPAERIATFDNDGTLWCEQPMYVQLAFTLDRVKSLARTHPDWRNKQPFKAALERDFKALTAQGPKSIMQMIVATHTGMSSEEFNRIVTDWITNARHPKFNRAYTELVYQPMLEALAYLRVNEFKTYIVSGGGVDFMRPWTERVYGIPPEQVVGSTGKLKYEMRDGKPVLMKLTEVDRVDDGPGKPVRIQKFIGRRPIAAFGNSDGDLEMLQYTAAGSGPRFMMIVRHTDAEREYAYDRKSHIGRLDKALDEANAKGWTVVDMKRDWKTIFPFSTGQTENSLRFRVQRKRRGCAQRGRSQSEDH